MRLQLNLCADWRCSNCGDHVDPAPGGGPPEDWHDDSCCAACGVIQKLVEAFTGAVRAGDLDASETAFQALGAWLRDQGACTTMRDVLGDCYEDVIEAFLEHERQKIAGPVIDDPNAHVLEIISALDASDGDEARRLMRELHGSGASGGPAPDHTHAVILVTSMRRKEWETGDVNGA